MDAKFKVVLDFHITREQEKKEKKKLTSRSFGDNLSDPIYSAEHHLLAGQFNWEIIVRKGRKKLLTINATYLVSYDNVPDVSEEAAVAFLRKVGRFAAYPYFRALVARLTSDARTDLPILPMLK
jgi:hypothetical protein